MSDDAGMRSAYEAKADAELAVADRLVPGADRVSSAGSSEARVMLVKGLPGPAEESGGPALSGADGAAIAKALEALGFDPNDTFSTLSRAEPGSDEQRVVARLQMQIEAVDPVHIVALDETAASDVAAACSIRALKPGRPVRAGGRNVLAVAGFEASLSSPEDKKRVWAQLKTLVPEAPVW